MRRILALIVAAGLGVAAFTMVEPAQPVAPEFGTTLPPEPDGAGGDPSVWYCSWVDSGALRDSSYDTAALIDVAALVTLPSPIPNEDADVLAFDVPGPAAVSVDTATVVRRGEAPGFVEFDDGPATASSVVWGDNVLTGDRCVASVPKIWHLSGGTTAEGFFSSLRLFNPFPENAKVSVNAVSEFGAEPLPELSGFDIGGRSWVTIDLTRVIPFLDQVSFTVETEQGLVIPSLVLANESDEASWPGTSQATTWDFPIAADGNLDPSLVVTNTGSAETIVAIDVFSLDGPIIDAFETVVPPVTPVRIALGDLAAPPFGVRVRSSAPVSAAVEAREPLPDPEVPPPEDAETTTTLAEGDEIVEDEVPVVITGLAGTVGSVEPSARWLVPGVGLTPDTTATIWIMNTGPDAATVTVTDLSGDGPLLSEKRLVEGGSLVGIPLATGDRPGVEGYLIESSEPISVAWSIAGERGVAFLAGVAVGE